MTMLLKNMKVDKKIIFFFHNPPILRSSNLDSLEQPVVN